eukprot:TRINITY_DN6282_c0_g1_i8.p3 TRINITY_DN6282_c0_g1~~TRINITY_DN6282_c0_g1_i8.p3  ORF type:complete len:101 (-),score=5.87 TRINITY_DN6282_c0_g1_i8:394-657(-)
MAGISYHTTDPDGGEEMNKVSRFLMRSVQQRVGGVHRRVVHRHRRLADTRALLVPIRSVTHNSLLLWIRSTRCPRLDEVLDLLQPCT